MRGPLYAGTAALLDPYRAPLATQSSQALRLGVRVVIFGDLYQYLVRPHHAQLETGLLLDHFHAFLEVAYLGRQPLIGLARLVVVATLGLQRTRQFGHMGNTAAANPQLRMQDGQQRCQGQRNESEAHGGQQRMGG